MILVLIFIPLGAVLAYNSSLLQVTKVSVVGNSTLKTEAVVAAADLIGKNILTVKGDEVAHSLKKLPLVEDAHVRRQPWHRVVISIEERQPWGIWQGGKSKYLIDGNGFVIEANPTPASINLPLIVQLDEMTLKVGDRVDPDAVQLAQKLIYSLPQELGASAQRFEYLGKGGLVVITDKGWRARFGDLDNFEYKLAVWKAILEQGASTKMRPNHVDLRFGTRPFYRQ
ncbi:MAG: FtsQ-type POTRA domain-containing protein [Chloroflexi bacterium]|nr:FtsQ-type POTRA domain-containing protein [Chloroflexota bacterium]